MHNFILKSEYDLSMLGKSYVGVFLFLILKFLILCSANGK